MFSLNQLNKLQVSTSSVPSLGDPHFLDSTLISLGKTCKAMHSLSRDILLNRDEILNDMLSCYYSCVNKYNINLIKEANLLCLGEVHESITCQNAQKILIDFLAKRGPVVVLLETLPSMQPFTKKELENVKVIANKLESSGNIHYIGWDDEKSVAKVRDEKVKFENTYVTNCTKLIKEIDELKVQIKKMTDKVDLLKDEIQAIASREGIKEKYHMFGEFGDYLLHLEKRLKNLEAQDQINNRVKKIIGNVKSAVFLDNQCKKGETALLEYKTISIQACQYHNETYMCKLISETFPPRTHKMVMTLSTIKNYILENLKLANAKIVLISGLSHLGIKKMKLPQIEFDLTPFYEEIRNHRAAIFFPKALVADL